MIALTHAPSQRIRDCELTYLDRCAIDWELAATQHAQYRAALSQCGAQVRLLEINQAFPDSPFVEDLAVVLDEVAVIGRMGAESRRGEVQGLELVLSEYRPLQRIQSPAKLEGGDVLRVRREVLVGLSSRTNHLGIVQLIHLIAPFGYRVWPVRVNHCLHLKTACTAVADDVLLVNSDWLNVEDLPNWRRLEAAEPWGANALSINQRLVCHSGNPRTIELLQQEGLEVIPVDLSEFAKAEAGPTCLSLVVR